jgi:ATP-binding cassette subfamily B protein
VTDRASSPLAAFADLFRWYRPYLRGFGGLISWTLAGTAVFLICVAVTPLLVEWILHHGEWDTRAIVGLIALIVLQLVVSYFAHIGAHRVANESTAGLRLQLFDRILASRMARQQGLDRSSVVSRPTEDVDTIQEAVETTLATGLPGLVRVVQSLVLLTIIEWRAGVVMTIAAIGFVVLHRGIGRRLMRVDRDRLQAASDVATLVDESITSSRVIAGLRLDRWQRGRFAALVTALEHRTHEQGVQVSRLVLSAHTAGLVGLLAVTLFAVIVGGDSLAGVAAAILYVESVVVGLESLPPWVRSLQLAVVSRHRIDMVLQEPDRVHRPEDEGAKGDQGLVARSLDVGQGARVDVAGANLALPPGGVLGIVSRSPYPAAALVATLAGDADPRAGQVTLDGIDVRSAAASDAIAYVPIEAAGFDVSPLDELRAADPDLTVAEAVELLHQVGLGHLVDNGHALDAPMGPAGGTLSVADRQLLSLATAGARRPRLLLIGALLTLIEADTALPVVAWLREQGHRGLVLSVHDPAVAEAVDMIAFLDAGIAHVGTHQELLVSVPAYAQLWQRRLSGDEVDLSVLGLAPEDEAGLYTRLLTESYAAGEPIYRQGAPADRILFVISGQVAVTTTGDDGDERRIAVLGPGNHCGDLRLTVGERRAESAWALTPCVLRSLSREAVSAGLTGLLDRTPTERRIVASLLRAGPASAQDLKDRLPDVDARLLESSLALLRRDGALRELDGVLTVVQRRSVKAGARELLDRLGDL